MKTKRESKENNKRRFTALMLVLLMCVMGFTLTGCGGGSGSAESGDSESDYEDPGYKVVTLTEAFQEEGRIWYCLYKTEIGKEKSIRSAVWCKGGQWYYFDPAENVKMGDLAQMTDEEIIQSFKEKDGVETNSGTARVFTTSKPVFHVYTDETGNTVVAEKVMFPYFNDQLDPPQDAELNYNYGRESYSVQQTIYESQYIGFEGGTGMNMDPDHAIITRADSDEWVEFAPDPLGTEGIEVD